MHQSKSAAEVETRSHTPRIQQRVYSRRSAQNLSTHDLDRASIELGHGLRPPRCSKSAIAVRVPRDERDTQCPGVRHRPLLNQEHRYGGIFA